MSGAMRSTAIRRGHLLAGVAAVVFACSSHSPFRTSPSEIALHAPCTYMGTVHKESRARIEALRACGAVSLAEWKCMARTLEDLDRIFTAECGKRSLGYAEISAEQRSRFAACFAPERPDIVACTPLDAAPDCLEALCGGSAPGEARWRGAPETGYTSSERGSGAPPRGDGSDGRRA